MSRSQMEWIWRSYRAHANAITSKLCAYRGPSGHEAMSENPLTQALRHVPEREQRVETQTLLIER